MVYLEGLTTTWPVHFGSTYAQHEPASDGWGVPGAWAAQGPAVLSILFEDVLPAALSEP